MVSAHGLVSAALYGLKSWKLAGGLQDPHWRFMKRGATPLLHEKSDGNDNTV